MILTYLHSDVYVGCDVFSYLGRFDLLVSFGIAGAYVRGGIT